LEKAAIKAGNPSWIGTFHSISARILRIETAKNNNLIGVDKNFVIYDTDESEKLVREILNELDISSKDFTPSSIVSAISKAKGEMMTPNMFESSAGQSYYYQKVARIYPLYQKRLIENNALDFGDLLFEVVKIFKNNSDILKKYQRLFRYVLIDEYQDTNKVQYSFVNLIAKAHGNLTVVGDVSQSIYSWRGADYKNMIQFEKDYPDAKIFKLAQNYRSTKNIIRAAKKVIENNRTHIESKITEHT
jgi:DNA helicase II / ATP-dependent DNA helicase PcrA